MPGSGVALNATAVPFIAAKPSIRPLAQRRLPRLANRVHGFLAKSGGPAVLGLPAQIGQPLDLQQPVGHCRHDKEGGVTWHASTTRWYS